MNTNPDNDTVLLWLDDELEGAALTEMNLWARSQPQLLTRREELRQWKRCAQRALPLATLPAAEMFHASLARAIQQSENSVESPTAAAGSMPSAAIAPHQSSRSRQQTAWQRYASAAALIAIGMGLGLIMAHNSHNTEPATVYTPEQGVHANVDDNSPADATVIVLDGAALSDNIEIPENNAQAPAPNQSEMSQSLRLSP